MEVTVHYCRLRRNRDPKPSSLWEICSSWAPISDPADDGVGIAKLWGWTSGWELLGGSWKGIFLFSLQECGQVLASLPWPQEAVGRMGSLIMGPCHAGRVSSSSSVLTGKRCIWMLRFQDSLLSSGLWSLVHRTSMPKFCPLVQLQGQQWQKGRIALSLRRY